MADYNEQFKANPVAFLNKHIIIPVPFRIDSKTRKQGQVFKKIVTGIFDLTEIKNCPLGGIAQDDSRAFHLNIVEDLTGWQSYFRQPIGIHAYWLAYEANKVKHAVLGSAADYMFTANISGCTFGYGSRTSAGDVIVGHANAEQVGADEYSRYKAENPDQQDLEVKATNANRQAQQVRQLEMLQQNLEKKSHTTGYPISKFRFIDPSGYDRVGLQQSEATIVGWRKDSHWQFWCQRRIDLPQHYVLKPAIPI